MPLKSESATIRLTYVTLILPPMWNVIFLKWTLYWNALCASLYAAVCLKKKRTKYCNYCFLSKSTSVSVTQLLERISEVVEQNRLFTSDRPGLGQELDTMLQHLESLSSTPLPTDYNNSQGLTCSCTLLIVSSRFPSLTMESRAQCLFHTVGHLNLKQRCWELGIGPYGVV